MAVGAPARGLGRVHSTAATVARRSASARLPTTATIEGSAPGGSLSPASTPAVPAAVSYGAWTHANRHLTRQERIEGLREFLQARSGPSKGHAAPTAEHTPTPPDPAVEADSQSISCAQQPRTRAERVAQIQRFAQATRTSGSIDYSQSQIAPAARQPDPIIVSPLPAGWRLSSATGMPVFSYGEWLLSHDDSQMDRATAARQFLRYARKR